MKPQRRILFLRKSPRTNSRKLKEEAPTHRAGASLFSVPSTLLRYVILPLCLLLVATSALAAPSTDEAYLAELIRRSTQARLSEERFWHLLLHYRRNLWGGYTSEADDPGFFLAPQGKDDPQAELEATLRQFFSQELVGRSQQPAQCAFIARYHWLKQKLGVDDQRLPPQPCERFENWYAELNPQSVSLIFPSAFMNNPASMFGHTLLRIDQQGQTEQTRILAYTINYAADVPPNPGVMYAVRGIGGGYQGYFSTVPYYLKVQEYGDIENRDIWEYRLNLTENQIRWMLMHAWELGNAYFDYYFFKENCSYHLLSLVEVADPTLRLRDQFLFWTVPADTVRLLTRQPGLVKAVTYRPARSTEIKEKRKTLTDGEQHWVGKIVKDPGQVESEDFHRLDEKRQAFVLDVVSDYLRYKSVTDKGQAETYKSKNRTVLVERSKRRVKSDPMAIESETGPPERGHDTSRVGVGVGWRDDELVTEATFRLAYHDLLDPDDGYSPDSQIELLSAAVRYYEDRDQTRLERLTFANVLSLSPMDSLFKTPSWKVSAGLETVRGTECSLCSNWNLNGGIGAAFETHWLRREVYFAFAEADANYSEDGYEDNHRVGGGGTLGVMATLTDRLKMLASGSYLGYAIGDTSDDARGFVGLRYTVQRNWALRFEFNHRDHDDQGIFSVQAFF